MNTDIVVLSSIIATLFVVFGVGVYKEFSIMEKKPYEFQRESGPRAGLVNFVSNMGKVKSLTDTEKKIAYQAMYRTISDMESNGMYFDDSIKEELKKQRDELNCEYSGLPSPKAYEDN